MRSIPECITILRQPGRTWRKLTHPERRQIMRYIVDTYFDRGRNGLSVPTYMRNRPDWAPHHSTVEHMYGTWPAFQSAHGIAQHRRPGRPTKLEQGERCDCGKLATHIEPVTLISSTEAILKRTMPLCDACHELFLEVEGRS